MPFNDVIELEPNVVTPVTENNITRITVKNLGASTVYLRATVGSVAPTYQQMINHLPFGISEGEKNMVLSEAFPGLPGANRVYMMSRDRLRVFVSHD